MSGWMHSKGLVLGVATVLAALSFWLILSTSGMGYTRDESFYFRFAQVYQDWFVALGSDRDSEEETPMGAPLTRDGILRTWRQNHEHPPLVKVLMGASWRIFGRKERPATYHRPIEPVAASRHGPPTGSSNGSLSVREIRPSHGFAVGERVQVLGPQKVGQAADDPRRVLGWGAISKRGANQASVQLGAGLDLKVERACKSYGGRPQFIRGCSVVSPGVVAEGAAMRLVGPFFTAILVFGMVVWGWLVLHPFVGVLSPLLFLGTPRWFFHGHLAAFDMPVTAMVFLVTGAFWFSLERPRWAWVTAFLWGFAILTKHNALFLPVPLVIFWLWSGRRELALELTERSRGEWLGLALFLGLVLFAPVGAWGWRLVVAGVAGMAFVHLRLRLPRIPLAFLLMPPIGVVMLFTFWPKLWIDPYRALESYFNFHLRHEHYLQYYLGRVLEAPPFPLSFPFAMTLFTVPALIIVGFLLGAVDLFSPALRNVAKKIRRIVPALLSEKQARRTRVGLFLAIQMIFPVLLIALPSTPIFGGVKHWMTGMPFLCLFAAWGIWRLAEFTVNAFGSKSPSLKAAVGGLLALAVLLPGAHATARIHLVGNSHFNGVIGGAAGAADKKLTRIYWGYSSALAFGEVNRRLPKGARVYFHDTTHDAFTMYRREGRIRHDLRFAANIDNADVALFEEQKFFAQLQLDLQRQFNVPGPAWSWSIDGVPMVSLYVRSGYELAREPTAGPRKQELH